MILGNTAGSVRSLAPWIALALAACGGEEAELQGGSGTGSGGASGAGGDGGATPNPDGDCLSDEEEAMLGTDPALADSDADGVGDCDEVACVSDPIDGEEVCYACGWRHDDPGDLVATGAAEGDVIANLDLVDQCNEPVKLWDFAREYHILFMTASW
ncbi:MAG: hypothetical protein WKG00_05045 [Polyangiaceae bacterium]